MSDSIEDWWPQLDIELRRWIVNNIWTLVHVYARQEILSWIGTHPDSTTLRTSAKSDPRGRTSSVSTGRTADAGRAGPPRHPVVITSWTGDDIG